MASGAPASYSRMIVMSSSGPTTPAGASPLMEGGPRPLQSRPFRRGTTPEPLPFPLPLPLPLPLATAAAIACPYDAGWYGSVLPSHTQSQHLYRQSSSVHDLQRAVRKHGHEVLAKPRNEADLGKLLTRVKAGARARVLAGIYYDILKLERGERAGRQRRECWVLLQRCPSTQ